jgi:hypothetical protein
MPLLVFRCWHARDELNRTRLLRGLTVTSVMRSLDRRQGRDPDALDQPPPGRYGVGHSVSARARTHKSLALAVWRL